MLWFIVLQWLLVVDSRLVFPTDSGCCAIDLFSFWCSVDSLKSVPGVIDVELAWIEWSTLMQSLQEMNAKQDMQVAIRASPRKIRKRYTIVNPGIVNPKSSVIFTLKTDIHIQMYLDFPEIHSCISYFTSRNFAYRRGWHEIHYWKLFCDRSCFSTKKSTLFVSSKQHDVNIHEFAI